MWMGSNRDGPAPHSCPSRPGVGFSGEAFPRLVLANLLRVGPFLPRRRWGRGRLRRRATGLNPMSSGPIVAARGLPSRTPGEADPFEERPPAPLPLLESLPDDDTWAPLPSQPLPPVRASP